VLTYDSFFAFADPENNESNVEFQTSNTEKDPLLTGIGGDDVNSDNGSGVDLGAVSNGDQEKAEISTGTASTETEDLDIVIGSS